jgi:hypothetical protein
VIVCDLAGVRDQVGGGALLAGFLKSQNLLSDSFHVVLDLDVACANAVRFVPM